MTVKEFLTRYDNKETFTSRENQELYWGDIEEEDDDEVYEIDTIYGDKGRWSRYETKILSLNGRYFDVTADIGLTEYQDNYYDQQPIEVKRVQKTIVVDTWEAIKNDR